MALDQSALTDLLDALRAGGDLDFMREAMQLVLQALIELEATEVIGDDPLPPTQLESERLLEPRHERDDSAGRGSAERVDGDLPSDRAMAATGRGTREPLRPLQ